MQRQPFKEVPVAFGRAGDTYLVNSVRQAAEMMLDDRWPGKGASDRKAREALLAAMEGTGSVEDAREAFRRAAKAAKILRER